MGLADTRDSSPGQKEKDDDKYEPTTSAPSPLLMSPPAARPVQVRWSGHAVTVRFPNKV